MSIENNLELLNILELICEDQNEVDSFENALHERMVVFSCMGVQFGISHQHVIEILRAHEFVIYKVPRTRLGVLGMINLRGDIVPIIDFRRRFLDVNCTILGVECSKIDQTESAKSNRIIIVQAKGIKIGLFVEDIIGFMTFLKESFLDEYTSMIEYSVENNNLTTYILKLDELF